ncbi:MAG: metallophosphoesterase [Pirellulales bacterium]|nr:metallophosphoesterase [Pirellulales bacterium]
MSHPAASFRRCPRFLSLRVARIGWTWVFVGIVIVTAVPQVLFAAEAAEAQPSVQPRPAGQPPVFTFGLFADVQYGDKPDRGARRYGTSLERLKQCVAELNRHDLDFVIQLGDVIDGNDSIEKTRQDLDRVLAEFARLDARLYHVVGNHCLTAGRNVLQKKLELAKPYYDFVPQGASGWRIVVLDGNIAGYGVLGKDQTQWLRVTLAKATRNGERVIVFNHFPLLKKAAPQHRMKKVEPLRTIINESGCVVAYLAGHQHSGGYTNDEGIHHVTVQGMVEAPKRNAYAIVDVFEDRITIRGFGKVPNRSLSIKRRVAAKTDTR